LIDIDLNQHVQGVPNQRSRLIESLHDFGSIDCLHPIKLLGDLGGFVALNVPNEVPGDGEVL